MSDRRPPPDACANCGAHLPRSARACPECGADEHTGWRDTSVYDGLNLPEDAWRDDSMPARHEAGSGWPRREGYRFPWYWWCVGALLIGALILGALRIP
jgi:hypothetical protein